MLSLNILVVFYVLLKFPIYSQLNCLKLGFLRSWLYCEFWYFPLLNALYIKITFREIINQLTHFNVELCNVLLYLISISVFSPIQHFLNKCFINKELDSELELNSQC